MKVFQVLTVTQTLRRAQSLAVAMKTVVPTSARHLYHFVALEDLSLEALLPRSLLGLP
jgi:hypothetical protein